MRRLVIAGVCVLLFSMVPDIGAADFVHPGGLFKKSDMDRMRDQVEAEIDPWHASFEQLRSESGSSYDYSVRGEPGTTTVSRDPPINRAEFESDVTAAYLNALMWIVTGDERHADKCVEIFNTWKDLTEVRGGGTESLNAGLLAWKLVEAAEIIRSTYDGWPESEIREFQNMLVYPGYSNTEVPDSLSNTNGTFYWRIYRGDPGRHGNQDMIAWRAMITMGVFLDNRIMYDRALRYFMGESSRSDDLPYPSGPSPSGDQIADNEFFTAFQYRGSVHREEDYGYNGVLEHYIWENGQNQESSRDQQHAFFGLGIAAGIAEVAWNQGDDAWNHLDNRLLKGFEFMAKYNTSYIASFPDQPEPWEPETFIQRTDRTGRWFSKNINPYFESDFERVSRGDFPGNRPVYEQAAAHFKVRMGLEEEAVWTLRSREVAIEEAGLERTGFSLDHPGWGGLTFRRPEGAAGDPIQGFSDGVPEFGMNRVPRTVQAENYDHFTADGEGRTYHDESPGNSGGEYRDDGVDIGFDSEEGFYLTELEPGEWITYTVSVPDEGWYRVEARYAAENDGGAIRIAFDGVDIAGDVSLPGTSGFSVWSEAAIAEKVYLNAGVQAMRVFVAGDPHAFRLSRLTVANADPPENPPEPPEDLAAEPVSSSGINLEWTASSATSGYNVKRSMAGGGPYETIAAGVSATTYRDSGLDADAEYYYVVSAINDAGESGNASEAAAVTHAFADGAWDADRGGRWGDGANWVDGVIADGNRATADFGRVAITANRTVTLDGQRTIGHLLFGRESASHGWAVDSGSGGTLTLADESVTPSVAVADASATLFTRLSGSDGFVKSGDGVLVLDSGDNDFTGDVIVTDGVLRASAAGALGAGTLGDSENRIVVEDGGTFELGADVQIVDKQVRLAGAGADDGTGGTSGAFYLDATGTGNGTRWSHDGSTNPAIALDADATIRIDGDGFGQNSANLLTNHLDLGGHTLTKTGTGRITLDQNNTATGVGTIHVAEGVFGITQNDIRDGVDLVVGEAGEVRGSRDPAPLNSTANTVTVDGRLVLSDRTDLLDTNQNIGALLGNGVITTGIWGNAGVHTLNIRHRESDSFFGGTIEEAEGTIHLVKGQPGDAGNTSTLTLDGQVRHSGDTTVNAGTFVLGENGVYTFRIGQSGSSNRIFGEAAAVLNGGFRLDLGDAGTSVGDRWELVDAGALDVTFGDSFYVADFTEVEAGTWRANATGAGYQFDEETAVLEVFESFDEEELEPMATAFEMWQSEHFEEDATDPEIAGPESDPDGDGIVNFLEFALGGDPLARSRDRVPTVGESDGYLTLTFRRVRDADGEFVYRVEASADPAGDWTEIWNSNNHPYDSGEASIEETVRDLEPIAAGIRRFLRLNVSGE